VVICLQRCADLHMAQLMPLPLTVSCFSKTQIGFAFLVPAYPGSPRQRAVKRVCVCVCVCIVAKEDQDTAAGSVEPWTDNLLNLVFLKIGPLYANENTQTCTHANRNTQGEVTSHNLCSRCDRHFVGITRHSLWSYGAKI